MVTKFFSILLVIGGGLITIICFVSAILVTPQSAPQQAVQELRYIESILGLLIVGVGAAADYLGTLTSQAVNLRPQGVVGAVPPSGSARKPCPYCAELILPAARVCRFCSQELSSGWADEVRELAKKVGEDSTVARLSPRARLMQSTEASDTPVQVGDRVSHGEFGTGFVESINGDTGECMIRFDRTDKVYSINKRHLARQNG